MDNLLDMTFSTESSLDGFDYSSDLLLSDNFASNVFEDDEDVSVLLQPKIEPESLLSGIQPNDLCLDQEPSHSLDSPPLDMNDLGIFELSFVPDPFDLFETKLDLPIHCAPMPEPEVGRKKTVRKAQAEKTSTRTKKARTTNTTVTIATSPTKKVETSTNARNRVRGTPEQIAMKKEDDKYQRRLVANKRSAQASRERKKALRCDLEDRVTFLSEDNLNLATEIEKLEAENKVLKREFVQLQQAISESAMLSKFMPDRSVAASPEENSGAASVYLMMVFYSFSQYMKAASVPTRVDQCVGSPVVV